MIDRVWINKQTNTTIGLAQTATYVCKCFLYVCSSLLQFNLSCMSKRKRKLDCVHQTRPLLHHWRELEWTLNQQSHLKRLTKRADCVVIHTQSSYSEKFLKNPKSRWQWTWLYKAVHMNNCCIKDKLANDHLHTTLSTSVSPYQVPHASLKAYHLTKILVVNFFLYMCVQKNFDCEISS